MKVFKFYSGVLFYGFSGKDEAEAKERLFEVFDEMQIDKIEEIPESEWDEKFINMWEDNDFEKEPYKVSIRENLFKDAPQLVFTNDMSDF